MKNILLISLIVCFASWSEAQNQNEEFLARALPEEVALAPEQLERLQRDIESDKLNNIHCLILLKDDKLIYEKYFGETGRDELHYTASLTKSFASALLGIAIGKGYFGGDINSVLDRPVSELFPEYEDIISADPLKKGLKLKHILSMSAGFEWDEHTYPYTDGRNDCNRINHSSDPMKFLFERPLRGEPGTEFYYNGGLSLSISWLIEKYAGMSVDKFAEKYLFNALVIKEYRWENVAGGLIDTDGGLHLSAMDQAKLGYLFLNGGVWDDKQVVPEEWVRESTEMRIHNIEGPDYGFQWWGGEFHSLNFSCKSYLASGHGGQIIMVVPEHSLVVVVNQEVFSNPFGQMNFLAIMSDYLIPALSGKVPERNIIEVRQEELVKLEGNYTFTNPHEFIDVQAGEGMLVLRSSDGQQNEFYPVSANTYVARILDLLDVQIEFQTDAETLGQALVSNFGFTRKSFIRH